MNILAIDFGQKNIGLAWTNTEVGVVLPFGLAKSSELAGLIKKEKIDQVVVGLPLGLDGQENANTARVRVFVSELQSSVNVPVEFYDERFSSKAADAMSDGGVSRDEKSAMVILEDYLAQKKNK